MSELAKTDPPKEQIPDWAPRVQLRTLVVFIVAVAFVVLVISSTMGGVAQPSGSGSPAKSKAMPGGAKMDPKMEMGTGNGR